MENFPIEENPPDITRRFYSVVSEEPYGVINASNAPGAVGFPSRFTYLCEAEVEDERGKTLLDRQIMSFCDAVPGSYQEDERYRLIDYIHLPSKKYITRIIHDSQDDIWMAKKATIEGDLIETLYNKDLKQLMRHLLLSGHK